MASQVGNCLLSCAILLIVNCAQGIPVPAPAPVPQVLPGQIPPHLSTHPALSSITQGRESALMQYAYNIQNRRGPSPSPLVLQNNQERNLQLANSLSHRRSGQAFVPSSGGHLNGNGGHDHSHGNENPEIRAFDLLNKYKGQEQTGQSQPHQHQHGYNPVAFTPSQPGQSNYPHPPGGIEPSHVAPGDENEGEDIRRLKSLLNLGGRPIQGIPPGSRSPTIGVAGERGVLNPAQFGQPHHDHHAHPHPTPIPATAQSQNSLGNLQYGQSPRPHYHGSGPTGGPTVHLPYGTDSHQHAHHHDHHNHGQDAKTLIQSLETSSDAYQNLVYIDPVREPTSINKHIGPTQSVFILPASDYTSDDYQRLLNRPAEILIDVIPATTTTSSGGKQSENSSNFSLHNFSLLLTPNTYARCAQATHKRGYGGKCKLILKVGKASSSGTQPVQVSY